MISWRGRALSAVYELQELEEYSIGGASSGTITELPEVLATVPGSSNGFFFYAAVS